MIKREDVFISATYLTKLTGIESHADGNYNGRSLPDETDLIVWIEWIEKNYKFYYWRIDKFKYLNLNHSQFVKTSRSL